ARGGGATLGPAFVLRAITKNWYLVVPLVLIVSTGAAFYTLRQTKMYQSEATLLFDPNPQSPLGRRVETIVDMGAGSYWNNQEYYKTQNYVIRSLKVCRLTVQKLRLDQDPNFLADAPASTVLPAREVDLEDAARILQGRLSVSAVKESRLVRVELKGAD